MGSDIHIVMELREPASAEWVGVWATDTMPGPRPKIAERNYAFFAEWGVRGRSDRVIWPRNVPKDVSRLAWLLYMRAPTDHHSPTFATPAEFVSAYVRANPDDNTFRHDFALWDLLRLDAEGGNEWRLVFWFDN